jgi:uncharacterized membrane protein YqaE (UPF0057 family)
MKQIIAFSLTLIFLVACSSSNNVVSNRLLQKRKYNKGWHVNPSTSIDKLSRSDSEKEEYTENKSKNYSKTELKKEATQPTDEKNGIITGNFSKINEVPKIIVKKKNRKDNLTKKNSYLDENPLKSAPFFQVKKAHIAKLDTKLATNNSLSDSDLLFILLLILCFIVPPITVGIQRGFDSRDFLISLILFLIAVVFSPLLIFITGLFWLAAIVHALLILFDVI